MSYEQLKSLFKALKEKHIFWYAERRSLHEFNSSIKQSANIIAFLFVAQILLFSVAEI